MEVGTNAFAITLFRYLKKSSNHGSWWFVVVVLLVFLLFFSILCLIQIVVHAWGACMTIFHHGIRMSQYIYIFLILHRCTGLVFQMLLKKYIKNEVSYFPVLEVNQLWLLQTWVSIVEKFLYTVLLLLLFFFNLFPGQIF